MTIRVFTEAVKASDLRPGDLFSTAGPEWWDSVLGKAGIGQRAYIRTDQPTELADDPDRVVYRLTIGQDDESLQAANLGTLARAWLDRHQQGCKDPACGEPINMLAYLAHCLGVRCNTVNLAHFRDRLNVYETHCPNCTHLSN